MKKIISILLTAALGLTVFTACGKKNQSVSTDGSTSMEKVIGLLNESFKAESGIQVSYNPTGSGSGIKAVQEDRCDIGLSSRKLKDEEVASGLKPTVLAYDGIAIVVHPENPVTDLSLEQIATIYTGQAKSWKEVGGNENEIVAIGREAGSGTRDGFESITKTKDKCKYRQELTSTGDVMAAVAQNKNAIGYVSLSALKDNVKAVTVNGVAPTESTILDKSYVVQRPFVLVLKEGKKLSESAQRYFDYITSDKVKDLIAKAGLVSAK